MESLNIQETFGTMNLVLKRTLLRVSLSPRVRGKGESTNPQFMESYLWSPNRKFSAVNRQIHCSIADSAKSRCRLSGFDVSPGLALHLTSKTKSEKSALP